MKLDDLLKRVDRLVELASEASGRMQSNHDGYGCHMRPEDHGQLRSATLSFIEGVYGKSHSFYEQFENRSRGSYDRDLKKMYGVIAAIREEMAGGWLRTTRGLVSAEVFGDFLEMAEHLLDEGYKDPAAVMIGSVLEEHLRQMASKFGIPVETPKDGKMVAKKADLLNSEILKAGACNALDQKAVTAWLDLRNKAAHGKYGEYTREQVVLLLEGVRNYIARHQL